MPGLLASWNRGKRKILELQFNTLQKKSCIVSACNWQFFADRKPKKNYSFSIGRRFFCFKLFYGIRELGFRSEFYETYNFLAQDMAVMRRIWKICGLLG